MMGFFVSLTLLIAFALAVTLSTNTASAQPPCFDVTCEDEDGNQIEGLAIHTGCRAPDIGQQFGAYASCCIGLGGLPKLTPTDDCTFGCALLANFSCNTP